MQEQVPTFHRFLRNGTFVYSFDLNLGDKTEDSVGVKKWIVETDNYWGNILKTQPTGQHPPKPRQPWQAGMWMGKDEKQADTEQPSSTSEFLKSRVCNFSSRAKRVKQGPICGFMGSSDHQQCS